MNNFGIIQSVKSAEKVNGFGEIIQQCFLINRLFKVQNIQKVDGETTIKSERFWIFSKFTICKR